MSKALTFASLIVGILLLVLFGLDLAVGIPFRKASTTMDIGILVSAALLSALSWLTLRELK